MRSSTGVSVLYLSFRPSACQANVRPSSKVSSVSPVWRRLRQRSHNIYASLFLGHKELFHEASCSKMGTHSCASHYIQLHAQIIPYYPDISPEFMWISRSKCFLEHVSVAPHGSHVYWLAKPVRRTPVDMNHIQ